MIKPTITFIGPGNDPTASDSQDGVPNIEGGDSDTLFLSAQCYDGGDSSGD